MRKGTHMNYMSEIKIRSAVRADLPAIVKLLAEDPLGKRRENFRIPLPESYVHAFESIKESPEHQILVALLHESIAGVMQLSMIPNLTYQGRWRAQIEGLRVKERYRDQGIGKMLVQHAINQAKLKHCVMVQLTTDKQRPEANRFYRNLGFKLSHEGLKLAL